MDNSERLKDIVVGLIDTYEDTVRLYETAGVDVKLKEAALQGMVNMIQLQQVAIQNYANWQHVIREDNKTKED